MSYVQTVIQDGMKLHPVSGLHLQRTVPEEGALLEQTFFRAGVPLFRQSQSNFAYLCQIAVGFSTLVAQRNPDVFALDPISSDLSAG